VITDGELGARLFLERLYLPPELLSCEAPNEAIDEVETQIIPVEIIVDFPNNASFLGICPWLSLFGCQL
jgi:hypothetical protein